MKWFDLDHNTWELWGNLLSAYVQAHAKQVRTLALPRDTTELSKIVVVTLKAALEERGLDASGPKAQLVAHLLHTLIAE